MTSASWWPRSTSVSLTSLTCHSTEHWGNKPSQLGKSSVSCVTTQKAFSLIPIKQSCVSVVMLPHHLTYTGSAKTPCFNSHLVYLIRSWVNFLDSFVRKLHSNKLLCSLNEVQMTCSLAVIHHIGTIVIHLKMNWKELKENVLLFFIINF